LGLDFLGFSRWIVMSPANREFFVLS
jgi:hypothetical protein